MDIWVWLLIAAAFGGAIGWALHMLYLQRQAETPAVVPMTVEAAASEAARIAELEEKLNKAAAESEDLRQRSGIARSGEENAPIIEGSLAWRNRHLESRVRFLEGKLADVEADGSTARPVEDQNDEATRLRWRNRYLEGRVKYLEEELVRTGGLTPAVVAPAAPQIETSAPKPKAPEGDKPEADLGHRPEAGAEAEQYRHLALRAGRRMESVEHRLGQCRHIVSRSHRAREMGSAGQATSAGGQRRYGSGARRQSLRRRLVLRLVRQRLCLRFPVAAPVEIHDADLVKALRIIEAAQVHAEPIRV